jgi:phage-related protein (TIGR01555 family)
MTETRQNDLTGLNASLYSGGPYQSQTISAPYTLAEGNAYTPLSLNRILLSYSYLTQGLVQTIINQPVLDAFRGGFRIKTSELNEDEIASLMNDFKRPRALNVRASRRLNPNTGVNQNKSDLETVQQTLFWARLYGGAGLIVNTAQNFASPLDVSAIGKDSPLEFLAADRWELILSQTNIFGENPVPFNYYGVPLHRSRVIKVLGVEAPSYIRLRLQGWGMSEIERCIRAINSFIKFEKLVFELLDEAKVDVFKIQGFNDSLLTDDGTANATRRIQLANQMKNFQNALTMDVEDDYSQKQLSFSGLAEIWDQIRTNLSSDLKIPKNKLFGDSATGFGGGQDSLENYNSLVEGVRMSADPLLFEVFDLRCQQKFGFIPEYEIEWAPLKILDGVQEEQVKASKQKRIMEQFQARLITGVEASRALKTDGLLNMDTEVSKGLRDVEPESQQEADSAEPAPKKAK